MATVYGTYATKRDNTVPAEKLETQVDGGRIRVSYDSYSCSAVLALNDVIKLGKLPAGARVVGFWLKSADLGTAGKLDLGWEANGVDAVDVDGFLAAVDVNAAAVTKDQSSQANMPGLGKKFGAETQIIVTANEATTATSGTIEVCIQYVID